MSGERIIVPHRGLQAAKTRLAPVLDPEERVALARNLLAGVLRVARQAADDVVVITPAASLGPIVAEANAGLDQARAQAVDDGVEVLAVLHGDLPNLSADDVRSLIAAVAGARGVAIAPDRKGTGTNGLALRPPGIIGFRFGAGSFAFHLEEAESAAVEPAIVRRPGLAFDLDTPEDLARWLELGDAA
jgi:2-phospho-L-lactate guanylyltransferase